MRNIIYKSESIIPWDTQSAFKMTSYNTSIEENMVFCYLKAYVHKNNLVLCSYCFTETPRDFDNMHLFLNLNPEKTRDFIEVDYGFGRVSKADFCGRDYSGKIGFNSFKTDDEQGFYWCGEITIPAELIDKLFSVTLCEQSLLTINMTQTFANGDFAALFGQRQEDNFSPAGNSQVFVVLNY